MPSPVPTPEAITRLAGSAPRALTPLGGGRNSQVFRLETADGRTLALKAYFRHAGDSRDRLGTEFGALRFLWEQGIRCVPQPLALDATTALGLYEFIPGEPPCVPQDAELDAAWAFLVTLRKLSSAPTAARLPLASEAHFSLQEVAAHVQARLDRLTTATSEQPLAPELRAFLQRDLIPAWRMLREDCQLACPRSGVAFDAPLPDSRRTLSPSDFGFHNALRRVDGLVFVDFEYFGWDDPAKMLADFLLHPGMTLSLPQRQRFANGLVEHLGVEGLQLRARLCFPLFGIKWCLILLNEFLNDSLDRRTFADSAESSTEERQALQLGKARQKLQQLLDDHAHFPYFSH